MDIRSKSIQFFIGCVNDRRRAGRKTQAVLWVGSQCWWVGWVDESVLPGLCLLSFFFSPFLYTQQLPCLLLFQSTFVVLMLTRLFQPSIPLLLMALFMGRLLVVSYTDDFIELPCPLTCQPWDPHLLIYTTTTTNRHSCYLRPKHFVGSLQQRLVQDSSCKDDVCGRCDQDQW